MAEHTYGIYTKALAAIEGFWAQKTIKLAPEPEGDLNGLVSFTHPDDEKSEIAALFPPLHIAMIGDSMTVGCGTENQSFGFSPATARELSSFYERDVEWATYGKLGATMRRVRYRLLPTAIEAFKAQDKKLDVLYICAASNDVMAQREPSEYVKDLASVIDTVRPYANQIIVLGPGQLFNIPSLGKHLQKVLYSSEMRLIAATQQLCEDKNVQYVDMTQDDFSDIADTFYATDNFHPNARGYQYMAEYLASRTTIKH